MYTYTYVHKHTSISVTLDAEDDDKAIELLFETVSHPAYYRLNSKQDEDGNELEIE